MTDTNILLESGTNELEIVEFYLDEEKPSGTYRNYYGINVAKVLEIIQMPQLTDMPEASHPAVLGAFELRREIIPLIDLTRWLGRERTVKEPPKVIVTEFNRIKSAFLVSGVTRIHRINWQEVEAPTNYVSALTTNSITGVVRFKSRLVFLLDMEKITRELNPDSQYIGSVEEPVREAIAARELRVLLVDDNTMARNMIKQILEDAGFMVHVAENGGQAWRYLQKARQRARQEERPLTDYVDLVVSDIEMPVMDGHALTRNIKEDHDLRRLPVVLCSSIITRTLQHKGEAVGADAQISKAELGELAGTILELLNNSMD